MRRYFLALAILVVAMPLAAQMRMDPPHATLSTISYDSSLLGMKAPFNVILPAGYEESARRYPVLLLLHGLWGHYDDWANNTNIIEYAGKYPLIIVMPEGGNGWYTNGVAPNAKWEDYIMKEVMPYVEAHYRTLQSRRMWAVAGLSMGGYGAIKLGLKYHSLFSIAASMSGALEIPEIPDSELGDPKDVPFISIHEAFGPENSEARKANALPTLLEAAGADAPFIYLDCGTDDATPGLYAANLQFRELLQQKKIPHEYRERPGIHNWDEWDHQIQGVLRLIAERWHLPWCGDETPCDSPVRITTETRRAEFAHP